MFPIFIDVHREGKPSLRFAFYFLTPPPHTHQSECFRVLIINENCLELCHIEEFHLMFMEILWHGYCIYSHTHL